MAPEKQEVTLQRRWLSLPGSSLPSHLPAWATGVHINVLQRLLECARAGSQEASAPAPVLTWAVACTSNQPFALLDFHKFMCTSREVELGEPLLAPELLRWQAVYAGLQEGQEVWGGRMIHS